MPWGKTGGRGASMSSGSILIPLIQVPFPHSDFLLSIHIVARWCLLALGLHFSSSHPRETNHTSPQQIPRRPVIQLASGMPILNVPSFYYGFVIWNLSKTLRIQFSPVLG